MVNAKTLGTVYIHTRSLKTIKEKVIEIIEDSNKSLKWKGLLFCLFYVYKKVIKIKKIEKLKEEKMKEKRTERGVTLIALVVTIVVLLILAGVTISMLRGENGIIKQAQKANEATTDKGAEEKVGLSVSAARAKGMGVLTVSNLKEKVENSYGGTVTGEEFPVTVTIDGKEFTVKNTGEVTQDGSSPTDKISKTTSYVGYYADLDPTDGKIDGIIYADLAVGNQGSGQWGDTEGKYTIPTETAGLKDYYISQTNYNGNDANGKGFGTKDVISPTGTGVERFYIMALTDIDGQINGTFYDWYNAAYRYNNKKGMEDYASTTFKDFKKGKTNTVTMISKWNAESYGAPNQCPIREPDMWGQIQTQVNNGWFVPSKEEWAAFGGELGISKDDSNEKYYGNFGLSFYYWSSSQYNVNRAWCAHFGNGCMGNNYVNNTTYVRLSATF